MFFDAGETFSQRLTISTITIDNYNKEAYGLYECVANNHAGSEKARILVEAQSQSSSSEATTAATTTKYHECNDLSSITAILIPVLVFFILMFIILIVFILFLVLRQKRKTSENSVEMKEVRSNEMEEPQDNSCERKLDTFAGNYWAKATWPLPHRMKELNRGSTPNLNIVNSTDTITKYAPSEC
ncbi:uncharacterized protein LOC136027221 [Artemia franciscana]|uniref:uncharacterized protein LOC136027221 n=1 Tax=Artemia franciscana TaxID=6661 RepID=UPI0032DB87F5